jgi:hypothetical protein
MKEMRDQLSEKERPARHPERILFKTLARDATNDQLNESTLNQSALNYSVLNQSMVIGESGTLQPTKVIEI